MAAEVAAELAALSGSVGAVVLSVEQLKKRLSGVEQVGVVLSPFEPGGAPAFASVRKRSNRRAQSTWVSELSAAAFEGR